THAKQAGGHAYDVHGIVTVVSDVALPELEPFSVRRVEGRPTVRVRVGTLPAAPPVVDTQSPMRTTFRYRESVGNAGFAADLTVVQSDGTVLCYPKPMTISAHTVHAVQTPRLSRSQRLTLGMRSRLHSREGRRFAFILAKTGLPVATINAVIQLLIPPPKYS